MPRDDLLQLRRSTTAEWEERDPVLDDGEPGWDETLSRLKVGDGVRPWTQLPYATGGGAGGTVAWGEVVGKPATFPATTYRHEQSVPSADWYITHNLGRRPQVSVLIGGQLVGVAVQHVGVDAFHIVFPNPLTGEVLYA